MIYFFLLLVTIVASMGNFWIWLQVSKLEDKVDDLEDKLNIEEKNKSGANPKNYF